MQPCKTLSSKLEINFSVFSLNSPFFCLKPSIMQTAAASPLLRPLLTPKSFTFENSCQHLKICLASTWKQRMNCLTYHLIPPGTWALLRAEPSQNRIPTGYPDLQGAWHCSRGDAEQPYKEQLFFFPLITQLRLIGKSNNLRNIPLACAIFMNFHQFPCIAVANLVLVPGVHTVQAAVKARINKGNSTNINLVGKCCSVLHKFSIRVLIRDITTPKPCTPCRWQQDRQIISTGRDRHLRLLWHVRFL